MKTTAIDDVILALVSALGSVVDYPVYDGPSRKHPNRSVAKYLVIGGEDPYLDENGDPVNTSGMQQSWKGLGQTARDEDLDIYCVAVGKAPDNPTARSIALAAVQDASDHLGKNPTPETYKALVSAVTGIEVSHAAGGAVVTVKFTISASARLT